MSSDTLSFRGLYRTVLQFGGKFMEQRPLARLLSTFLCCLAIVIRPVSHLGGTYAFLVLPFQALVFGVQESLAQQLELTVLNIMGALSGIGFSTLAKYIASLTSYDSARSRATCAAFLIVISFFAGLIKSRLVRLTLSMRISLFVSIWLLTIDIGVPSRVLIDSGDFLYATLAPAILSLISLLFVMTFLRWSSSSFESDMGATFALLQQCLGASLNSMTHTGEERDSYSEQYSQLRSQLFQKSIMLNETYSQAAFELRICRLSLKSIRPLIGIVEHLRRELAWGMSVIRPKVPSRPAFSRASSRHASVRRLGGSNPIVHPALPSHEKFTSAIEMPALGLGHAIVAAMQAVELLILVTFDKDKSKLHEARSASSQFKSGTMKYALRVAEETLIRSRDEARERLGCIFDEMDLEQRERGIPAHYPQQVLDGSLIMIALLQMAHEMRSALQIADKMYTQYEESHVRLWYPHISLAWLGVPPGQFISDDLDPVLQLQVVDTAGSLWAESELNLTSNETREGLAEKGFVPGAGRLPSGLSYSIVLDKARRSGSGSGARKCNGLSEMVAAVWSQPWMLRGRIFIAKVHRAVLHSPHLRHAMKNAIGVAVLAFPAFLPADSTGRQWFSSWHGQWMVISYVWVLETNTGATWRAGYLRLVGTTLAAIYAYIVTLICHTNPYGLTALVTVADIPFTYMITRTSLSPLAVPASVTLPIIAFDQYIHPDPSGSILKLAAIRALMIAVGIFAALLMNALLFPRHCRVVFLSDTSRTLGLLSQLYMTLSHDMFRRQQTFANVDKRKTLKLELHIRNNLHRMNALIATMHDEISLLPKPLAHYRKVVTTMQRLLDAMTGLRKIRENIPRRETVSSVFNERREFMSCVCISLYACQHAFRAREPLPQFLPSPRHALDTLETHVQDSIRRAREEDNQAMGLSLVYAFAEQEVMKNMVDTLEELLELTGRLFGTSAWLTHEQHLSMTSLHEEAGERAWYSTFNWEET